MTAQIAATPDVESGSALISPQRRNFVFLAIMLGMLMAALDQTIVATALPTIEPTFDRLVRGGYAQRDVDRLSLTPSGTRQVDFVTTLIREWIVDKLARSPNFQGRPDRAQVEAALNRIARRIVAQPDWGEDRRRLSGVATERISIGASGGSGRTASP